MPHAQLFTGGPGYGGLPLAIEFALTILNQNNKVHSSRKLGEKCQNRFNFDINLPKTDKNKTDIQNFPRMEKINKRY